MVKRNERVGARSNVPLHIAKSQVEESTQLKPFQEPLNEKHLITILTGCFENTGR